MRSVHVRRLQPQDAWAVARLARKLYPRGFSEGWWRYWRYLKERRAGGGSLSIGLFDNKRLVGCVVAYVAETSRLSRLPLDIERILDSDVIFCDDLVIDKEYRRHILELTQRFFYYCRREFPTHSVVAYALDNRMSRLFTHFSKVAEFLGYRLSINRKLPDVGAGIGLSSVVLFQPLPENKFHALVTFRGSPSLQKSYDIEGGVYTLELIDNERDWQALEPAWDGLLQRTPGGTVFQSFDYLQIWWRHFGLFRELSIIVLRCEGEIVGIAPLQLTRVKILGQFFRKLGFIGSRWEVDRPKLLFPTKAKQCCEALLLFLLDMRGKWDLCEFYEQESRSASMQYLKPGFNESGYLVALTNDSISPYLRFNGTWKEFITSKSRKFRKNINASRRKLEKLGELEYLPYCDDGGIMAQLERYVELEQKSWKVDKGIGCNRNANYLEFHRDLVTMFSRSNAFCMRFLTLDGEPIAGTFGLLYKKNNYYSLQITYDRAYAKYSPGTLLEAFEIEECFDAGYKEYDFLGGYLNNKLRWTGQARNRVDLCLFSTTPRLYLFHFVCFVLKPPLKQLLQRLGLMRYLIRLQSFLKALRRPQSVGNGSA